MARVQIMKTRVYGVHKLIELQELNNDWMSQNFQELFCFCRSWCNPILWGDAKEDLGVKLKVFQVVRPWLISLATVHSSKQPLFFVLWSSLTLVRFWPRIWSSTLEHTTISKEIEPTKTHCPRQSSIICSKNIATCVTLLLYFCSVDILESMIDINGDDITTY